MINIQQTNTEAEALMQEAKALNKKGELAGAVAAYRAAAQLFAQAEDERGQTRAWSGAAKAYGREKTYTEAAEAFGEAARHAELAAWPDKEIEALYNRGLVLQQAGLKQATLGKVNLAVEAFQKALKIAESIGDQASVGVLLVSLGFACDWCKLYDEAIYYFGLAAPFALDNVDFDTAFSALSSLGVMLSNAGRAEEAIPHYERVLQMAKSTQGDIVAVADTYANLGIAYEKAGRLLDAIEAIDTYREILQVAGDVKAGDAAAMVKRLKVKAKLQTR